MLLTVHHSAHCYPHRVAFTKVRLVDINQDIIPLTGIVKNDMITTNKLGMTSWQS